MSKDITAASDAEWLGVLAAHLKLAQLALNNHVCEAPGAPMDPDRARLWVETTDAIEKILREWDQRKAALSP